LPTEAQWEFAAKGGLFSNNYKYSGGNDIEEVAWYNDNAEGKTHLVGSKKPNELGIYDMTGNVWELCLDDYKPDFYTSLQNPNKEILNFNDAKYKISRGGSWGVNVENGCFTCRYATAPTACSHDLGFRVCYTLLRNDSQ
jgi:formylglycine-generating enzyme required for sulfatase activity